MKNKFVLLATSLACLFCASGTLAENDCSKIKNDKNRLTCYEARERLGVIPEMKSLPVDAPSEKKCRGFEVASNTLKATFGRGLLRTDMLASGIAELIAKREACRLAPTAVLDDPAYETNISAFQDIYEALRVTESYCRNPNSPYSVDSKCSPQTVLLVGEAMAGYDCREILQRIPRRSAWIQQQCKKLAKVGDLITHIYNEDVKGF